MKNAARLTTRAVIACTFAVHTICALVEIEREFEYRNFVLEAQVEAFAFLLFALVSTIDFVWSGCASRVSLVMSGREWLNSFG